MKLSVVTTLYRSATFIEEFTRRMSEAARQLTDDYEIIMVDDGSPDDSLRVALGIQQADPRVKIIELSRNFGHHKAMMTGLEHAEGDLVFLIDVDLEEKPELLAEFHDEMHRGEWDVVYGIQQARKGNLLKRVGGDLGWRLINAMLPIQVPRNQTTVRLMRGNYVRALVRHKEQMTVIGGLWVITGFRQKAALIQKLCRPGTSYSAAERLRVLVDSITSFSEKPLYGVFFLGLAMFLLSVVVACYLILRKLTGTVLSGWVSVMVSVWGLSGVILLCLGLVGIYISRIFVETKQRPYVLIRNLHGFPNRKE